MKLRFRFLEQGGHTVVRLFAGTGVGDTLGKCGDLVMRNEEWKEFRNMIEDFVPADCGTEVEFINEEGEHSSLIPR